MARQRQIIKPVELVETLSTLFLTGRSDVSLYTTQCIYTEHPTVGFKYKQTVSD